MVYQTKPQLLARKFYMERVLEFSLIFGAFSACAEMFFGAVKLHNPF